MFNKTNTKQDISIKLGTSHINILQIQNSLKQYLHMKWIQIPLQPSKPKVHGFIEIEVHYLLSSKSVGEF